MKRARLGVRLASWLALCAWLYTATLHAAVPSFERVRAAHQPSDITLLDRHGEPVQTLRVDASVRRLPWVGLSELSPALREALVHSEDRRFWAHSGVDWPALAASAWANAWNTRTRGASTLTMQLAGLLEPTLARPAAGRSVAQKIAQMALAAELEQRWSKAQILEAYLNLVPLRGELVGVSAAAQQLLGKHASGLDQLDAAMLAALVRAPNAAEPEVTRRACALMQSRGMGCQGLASLVAMALQRRPGLDGGARDAPHFARYWHAAGGGQRTTLDAGVQRLALAALRQQLAELRGRNVEDGAVVVLDNASGEVRAWVGAAGAAELDAVLARRQPGSTLKPFVYAQAMQSGFITPQSLLLDEPLQLSAGHDSYQPQNFDQRWRGWISAREALASSLNVPAARVGAMLGPDAVFDMLNRAGLRLRESAGFHGHALALGSAEVTLLDLANAYRALANGGVWRPVKLVGPAAAGQQLFDAGVVQDITAILSDSAARAGSFGFDSPLVTRHATAVKTGTSKDMRDNWCVGFNASITVAVWLGNAGGAPMHGVSGVVGAAPVWQRLMHALPAAPLPAARSALVPKPVQRAGRAAYAIGPLRDGSVLALDPDIPIAAQRLRLHGPAGRWSVDGMLLGQATQVWWALTPGRHRVEVRDGERRLLDAISVEVRPGIAPAAAQVKSRAKPTWPSG
jgi:penicillin-binding protein 1C